MRSVSVVVAVLAVSWLCAVQATLLLGAFALGALATLKGAALVSFASGRRRRSRYGRHGHSYGHRKHYRHGRAIQSAADEGENLLLSTVGQLDPNGCVLKLLCVLEAKEEAYRTLEEAILVDMFANSTETLTSYNAAFVYATDVGGKTQDAAACHHHFPKCPLTDDQLSGLLQQAWGCGLDLYDDQQEPQTADQDNTPPPDQENTPPGGQDNTPPGGQDNTPPADQDNTPPADQDNTPPGGQDNTPPGDQDNTPPGGQDNTPPGGQDNTPPADQLQ
ncbi:uncharacterized protein LOC121869692 [Homarus americanus]|uniref:uncharacterized protein LOC121869692 n=1 Tax=Homarus americanus TaxID=6706 RepID=UPI001C47605D|nr:uncharacterized protein LOC121869692 [Homarus americanus]